MTRFGNLKKLIFILTLVSVLAVMLVMGIYAGEKTFNINSATNEDVSFAYQMSSEGWDRVVYKNAPAFSETQFIGEDAYYYALEEDENGSYSMQAELVSPKFDIYENEYTLTINYFTRQRSALPATITVMTSENGETFTVQGEFVCFDNNIPLDTWTTSSVNVSGKFSYLKFVITVYYSEYEGVLIENGGLYLAKEFTLTSTKDGDIKSFVFTAGITQTEDMVYNGEEQYPEVGISTDANVPYYVKYVAEQDGNVVKPINAGTYKLFTEIYDNTNELCFKIDTGTYEIKKQKIASVENVKIIANIDYAVILEADIKDENGARVDIDSLYGDFVFDATKSVTAVFEGDNYEEFSLEIGTVNPNAENDWLFYLEEKYLTVGYDGEKKSVWDNIKIFTAYDFENSQFTYATGAVAVKYYKDGEEREPVDAGIYTYEIVYGNTTIRGTLTIEPQILHFAEYVGESSIDKPFDGTSSIAVDGIIGNEFLEDDFVLSEMENAELKLGYESVKYERTVGRPYLLFDKPYVYGMGAENFKLSEEFYAKCNARISAVSLMWDNFTDKDGNVLNLEDKIYDADTSLNILNSADGEPSLIGLGDGTVTYGDITATTESADCGERKVAFNINNERLYDKYLPLIFTGEEVYCNIVKRELVAEITEAENTDKEYDMSVDSKIIINKIKVLFGEAQVNLNDGLKELLDTGRYYVNYESAVYDTANSGTDKTITVNGITLNGYDSASEKVFSNYKINELTYSGNIIAKQVEIVTEFIIIKTGEALPEIKTTGFNTDIEFITTIYASKDEAESGMGTAIPNKNIAKGEYFVRVACDENGNYSLGEGKFYVVLPLSVTAPMETRDQFIVSEELNDFKKFVVLKNGSYKTDFISVATDGKHTGLSLQYTADSDCITITDDGIITGVFAGETQVTVAQKGNEYYNEAESINFTVEVIDATFYTEIVGYETVLYNGDLLPSDIIDYTKVTLNGSEIKGNLVPTEGVLSVGTNVYKYVFSVEKSYIKADFDYSLNKELYEKNEDVFIRTHDVNYVNGKSYYIVEFEQVTVTIGEELALSGNIYYEYDTQLNGYKVSTDEEFKRNKNYYIVKDYTVDETFAIIGDFYVSDGNDGYVLTDDTHFADGIDYYYEGKQFYGEMEIDVELTAELVEMELILGGTVKMSYGQTPNFADLIDSIRIEGKTVPYAEYKNLLENNLFTLYLISYDENGELVKTDVTSYNNECGTYTIFAESDEEGTVVLEFTGEFGYNVKIDGFAECVIEKSTVLVEIVNMEKYYYENIPTDEEFLSEIKIIGTVLDEDIEKISQSAIVSTNITATTTVGEYVISLIGNGEEFKNYNVVYNSGFITVLPMPIVVTATSKGHVYKNGLAEINVNAIPGISGLDNDEKDKITEYVRTNTIASTLADNDSDVGDYPINIVYNGKDENFIISFVTGNYAVTPATITGMKFDDKEVLYDGSRHSITVEYDEQEWPDIEIEYDKHYFVEEGIYTFTATINNKNYNELVLTAKLTIGTITISSSSLLTNFVSIKINDESCTVGVNPDFTTKLVHKEADDNLVKKLESVYDVEKYSIMGAYDVEVYLVGSKKNLGYENYTITFNPDAVDFNSELKLFGYGIDGKYKELEYKYDSGKYTVNTSSLKDLVFVIEEKTEQNPIVTWILVIGFALLILLVCSIIFSGKKRGKRERRLSRKRHHRWV